MQGGLVTVGGKAAAVPPVTLLSIKGDPEIWFTEETVQYSHLTPSPEEKHPPLSLQENMLRNKKSTIMRAAVWG